MLLNCTLLPGKDFIFHNKASLSGAYVADPIDVSTLGFVASGVTGNSISTFVAVLNHKAICHPRYVKEHTKEPKSSPALLELAPGFYRYLNSTS